MLLFYYQHDIPCRKEQNLLLVRALQTFCPDADVTFRELAGGHCAASTVADGEGNYPFVTLALQWLQNA